MHKTGMPSAARADWQRDESALPADARLSDFDALYERYSDFVWRSLRRLGVPTRHLDDAMQEVFLVLHRHGDRFEGRSSIKTWVFGIVYHVARRTSQKDSRRREDVLMDNHEDERAASPHDVVQRAEAVQQLYAILDKLANDQRTVFVMAELECMSAPEMVQILGVPLNTVYSRLRAARKRFDAELKILRARERNP